LKSLESEPGFHFEERDVTQSLDVEDDVDLVLHMASPASPPDYLEHPIATLDVGSIGTRNCLELARAKGARFFLASTSECYGDPVVHPQPETYWGNVNPIGPRSVYDEAKRFSEALTTAYHRAHGLPVRIARIFNTYGPRMRRADGRAVPNFIDQALHGKPVTVHGDGSQTRSLCYVEDLIEGLWRLINSDHSTPMNIGNPEEAKVLELARLIVELVASSSELAFVERPVDDPQQRCPDISLARATLGWEPQVQMREGLGRTIEWARDRWT
ncbi:MAG TPA: GDP-mannose 4,6-dehydratase, partial [Actinomycetota bacterium]